jgi:hypothetical protein
MSAASSKLCAAARLGADRNRFLGDSALIQKSHDASKGRIASYTYRDGKSRLNHIAIAGLAPSLEGHDNTRGLSGCHEARVRSHAGLFFL